MFGFEDEQVVPDLGVLVAMAYQCNVDVNLNAAQKSKVKPTKAQAEEYITSLKPAAALQMTNLEAKKRNIVATEAALLRHDDDG